MRVRINGHPEIFQECPIITADVLIDLSQVGAEELAVEVINTLRQGLNEDSHLTMNTFLFAMSERVNSLPGVALEWIE